MPYYAIQGSPETQIIFFKAFWAVISLVYIILIMCIWLCITLLQH